MNADVIIVGAGLHGCSAALHLALGGLRVMVLEKNYAGRHASGVNAGGVRRLGRHPAEIPLSVASMEIWHRIEALVGSDCGFRRTGQIKVAENPAEMKTLKQRAERVHSLGYNHEEVIDANELRRLVPAVSRHCVGGLIVRDDGYANPFRSVLAFKQRAQGLGVEFREGLPVTGVERQGSTWRLTTPAEVHEAPVLVNCGGAWGDRLAATLGETVPLRIDALMLMVTERIARFLDPVIGATNRPLSFKQFENGTVVIGGGHRGRSDRDAETSELDFAGLGMSARTAVEIFPLMRHVRVIHCWGGLEGVTPDSIPVIGPSRSAEDAYHAFGFSAHGFQLGPIVGRIIADLVIHGATELPIEAFRIERFVG